MSVQFKDYYEVLGTDRQASPDQIKKAFRKLAGKYHPDRHKGDKRMEEKFKDINEAYEVLKDPEKRRRYDTLGKNWQQGQNIDPNDIFSMFGGRGGGGGRRTQRTTRTTAGPGGFRFESTGDSGFSDFFETLFGGLGEGAFGGGGNNFGGAAAGGFDPFGGGHRTASGADGNVETSITISLNDAIKGAKRRIEFQRAAPGGVASRQSYDVRIPPGIRDGQKIRLKGQGSMIGSRTGDILITVRIAPDSRYRIDGDNLEADLTLAPWEAALGSRIAVATPDGDVEVKIPVGIEPGRRLRVRGRGLPKKDGEQGDLMLRVSIQVPKKLNSQEKDLFERLAKISRFKPRK